MWVLFLLYSNRTEIAIKPFDFFILGSEKQWQEGSRAKIKKFDFVVDVFTPTYGTDCEDTIIAGYDVRHGAIGPGTLATHGYERTHKNAVKNTYILLKSYIVK